MMLLLARVVSWFFFGGVCPPVPAYCSAQDLYWAFLPFSSFLRPLGMAAFLPFPSLVWGSFPAPNVFFFFFALRLLRWN